MARAAAGKRRRTSAPELQVPAGKITPARIQSAVLGNERAIWVYAPPGYDEAGAPLAPRIDSEIANHLGFVEQSLAGREWLLGDTISGADIQMSFVGEAMRGLRARFPNIDAWVRPDASGTARWPARAV